MLTIFSCFSSITHAVILIRSSNTLIHSVVYLKLNIYPGAQLKWNSSRLHFKEGIPRVYVINNRNVRFSRHFPCDKPRASNIDPGLLFFSSMREFLPLGGDTPYLVPVRSQFLLPGMWSNNFAINIYIFIVRIDKQTALSLRDR